MLQNPDAFNEKWRNRETNKYGREIGLSLLRTALSASCNKNLLKKHKEVAGPITSINRLFYHSPCYKFPTVNEIAPIIEHSEKPSLTIEQLKIMQDNIDLDEDLDIKLGLRPKKHIPRTEDDFTYEGWREQTKEIRSKILCDYWKKGRCTDHEKGRCDYNHPKKTDLDAYTEGVYTRLMQMVSSEVLHALTIKAKREKPPMDVVDTLLALIQTYRDGDMTGNNFDEAVDIIRKKVNE